MTALLYFLSGWAACCSLFCFFLCWRDKRAAKRAKRRVAEKRFFLLAALGGGFGLWLGMRTFHHKTLHLSFRIAAPLSSLCWLMLLGWLGWQCFGEPLFGAAAFIVRG